MSVTSAPDLLATIVAATKRIVDVRARRQPLAVLERQLGHRQGPNGKAFERALRESPAPRVIAECKRRSPSRGILRADYDPAAHAKAYEAAGAAAISVLTEPTFFDGAPDHLRSARDAVQIPILRKDFIVSDYQVVEAATWGADAVLLIVAALEDRELRHLMELAEELSLACLVEVHEIDEVRRALDAGARIVGVNSRNLRTLVVDPAVLDIACALIPDSVVAVAESGIRTHEDLEHLMFSGYDAFLVGEKLITQPDPGAALEVLRGNEGRR
jgi:indole-3-glycerol phosphate synthase